MTPAAGPKHRLRQIFLGLSLAAGAASFLLSVTGGFDASVLGVMVTAHEPRRPLLLAVASLIGYVLLGGDLRAPFAAADAGPLGAVAAFVRSAARLGPPGLVAAVLLAVAVAGVGIVYGAKAAGGSDSYGYLSQAELWLEGDLRVEQEFVKDVPWPNGAATFTPLGFRSSDEAGDPGTILPIYAAGFPLMLAAAKVLGGQSAMFWVVPISGALLVLSTFGIGRRVASATTGLMGAWLVATSPIVLYMVVQTMTDVPVGALWAAAFYLLLGRSGVSAFGSGLVAGAAVLVRPNLVPLVAALGMIYVFRLMNAAERKTSLRQGTLFVLGTLPGVAAVAVINDTLYGSPLLSGYGDVSTWFRLSNIRPNLEQYIAWLIESQTHLALAGLMAVFLPWRRLWPAGDRAALVVMALFVSSLWLVYLTYQVFDAWWYLRFLLASWPFIMLGVGAIASWLLSRSEPRLAAILVVLMVGLGFLQLRQAAAYDTFGLWRAERRYIAGGHLVARLTTPNSVVFSMQHSGSVRYYGGRVSLRYDLMPEDWIDPAVDWLTARGVHTYLLIEGSERAGIERRFAGTRAGAALIRPPMATADEGDLALFDVSAPRGAFEIPERVSGIVPGIAGIGPGAPPRLVLRP